MKNVIILCICFICCSFLYGQTGMPNIIPHTPEVDNFLKYDFYPTNHTTGAMQVSIPIYTIKANGLDLPISISYHASGIKVNDIASEVGLGWVLNASGFVTVAHKGVSAQYGAWTDIRDEWLTSQEIDELYDPNLGNQAFLPLSLYFLNMEQNGMPSEASEFNYHAPGLSGGYMYKTENGNRTIINVPKSTDKIIPLDPQYLGMTIINENGVKYDFTESESLGNSSFTTNWHLTKMTSPTSTDEINFIYGIIAEETDYIHEGSAISIFAGSSICQPQTGKEDYIRKNDRHIPLLTQITFPNGYINFNYSNDRIDKRRYRLQNIKVYNKDNILLKEVLLHQSYFAHPLQQPRSDYQKNIGFRLKLDSVTFKDKNSDKINSYELSYNTEHQLPSYYDYESLGENPPYSNSSHYAQDLWGYYNGVSGNLSFLSNSNHFNTIITDPGGSYAQDFNTYSNYLANREINTDYAKTAILTGVKYPTGGSTYFEYESNTDGYGNKFGGLRIKKITQEVNQDETYYKEFNYLTAHYNQVYNQAGSFYDTKYECDYYDQNGNHTVNSGTIATMTSNSSVRNLLISQNPIYYSKIEEYEGTASLNKGKILYEYEYEPDFTVSLYRMAPVYYPKKPYDYVDSSWKRGQLKKTTFYKIESLDPDPIYREIKSVENNYSIFQEDTLLTGTEFYRIYIPPGYNSGVLYAYMDILTSVGYKKITSSVEKEHFVSGEETVKTTFYSYDNPDHMQITRSEITLSDNTKKSTIYKYPDDVVSISSLGADNLTSSEKAAIDKLKSEEQHRITEVIQTELFKDRNHNGILDSGELLDRQRTNYKTWISGLILPEFIQNSKGGSILENKIQFHDYYDNGNIKEISNIVGIHTIYLWGYNHQYPIAKIENSTISEIESELGKSINQIDENDINIINNLRNSLTNAMITTYTYIPLVGIETITDPRGYTTTYEYDDFNRLKLVKDAEGNILSKNEYHYQNQQ